MPITRPKPRQVSQAPSGELNENRLGLRRLVAMSHSAQADRCCSATWPRGRSPSSAGLQCARDSPAADRQRALDGLGHAYARSAPAEAQRNRSADVGILPSPPGPRAMDPRVSPAPRAGAPDLGFAEVLRDPDRKGDHQRGSRRPRRVRPRLARIDATCRAAPVARSSGSAAVRPGRTAASGGRSARSSCRPSSARSAPGWSGRSRSPAARLRSGRPAGLSIRSRNWRAYARRSRRSGAGPRRTACRTPATTCRSPTRRSRRPARSVGMSMSRLRRLFWRAPRMRITRWDSEAIGEGSAGRVARRGSGKSRRSRRRLPRPPGAVPARASCRI
jgi:hypothetical protein